MRRLWFVAYFAGWGVSGTSALADLAPFSSFDPAAVVESFEGLDPTNPDTPLLTSGLGFVVPTTGFVFSSGVALTSPSPNGNALVGDWSIGSAVFGIGGGGGNGIISGVADVPIGSAYIGFNGFGGDMEFSIPPGMLRVGAFATGRQDRVTGGPGTMTMTAFDGLGNVLDTQSISTVNVSQWGTNFLGIEGVGEISSVRFSGDFAVLDGLTFDSVAVPAPGAVMLGVLGLGMIGWLRRRSYGILRHPVADVASPLVGGARDSGSSPMSGDATH